MAFITGDHALQKYTILALLWLFVCENSAAAFDSQSFIPADCEAPYEEEILLFEPGVDISTFSQPFITSDYLIYYFADLAQVYDDSYSHYYFRMTKGPLDQTFGVSGEGGPLGEKGLFGETAFHPLSLFQYLGEWQSFSDSINAFGFGPRGTLGPLSVIMNPLTLSYLSFWKAFNTVDGPMAELGVYFHSGPTGPTGPNGPMGIWGQRVSPEGDFYLNGEKSFKAQEDIYLYQLGAVRFPLYEFYSRDRISEMIANDEPLDTSYAAFGRLENDKKRDVYRFTTDAQRWVSLMVVPDDSREQFILEVLDKKGEPVACLSSGYKRRSVPIIRMRVPQGKTFHFQVKKLAKEVEQQQENSLFSQSLQIYRKAIEDKLPNSLSVEEESSEGAYRIYVTGAVPWAKEGHRLGEQNWKSFIRQYPIDKVSQ